MIIKAIIVLVGIGGGRGARHQNFDRIGTKLGDPNGSGKISGILTGNARIADSSDIQGRSADLDSGNIRNVRSTLSAVRVNFNEGQIAIERG